MIITSNEKIWRYVLMIGLSLVLLIPLIVGVWVSLLPNNAILTGHYFTSQFTIDNYIQAITATPILRYLLNSLLVSAM